MPEAPEDNARKIGRTGRAVAGLISAVVGVHLVYSLLTGTTYSSPKSGAFFARSENPLLYWVFLGFGLIACLYFAAVAFGVLASEGRPADRDAYRRRRQRDGTVFGLLSCAALLYMWLAQPADFGDARSHRGFGLAIVALIGFVGLMAPRPAGQLGLVLRICSLGLVVLGFLGLFYA